MATENLCMRVGDRLPNGLSNIVQGLTRSRNTRLRVLMEFLLKDFQKELNVDTLHIWILHQDLKRHLKAINTLKSTSIYNHVPL